MRELHFKLRFSGCGERNLPKTYKTVLRQDSDVTVLNVSQIFKTSYKEMRLCKIDITLTNTVSNNGLNFTETVLVIFSKEGTMFDQFNAKEIKNTTDKDSLNTHQISHIKKRSIDKLLKSKKRGCKRTDMVVDFDKIGWGKWIIYPKTFNAYMCKGKCHLNTGQELDTTNHAILQSLMRMKNRSLVSRPCCVPTKLSALSMLYYDKRELVVKHHEDMIVEECGCR